jgi:hypothetical protein
MLLFDLFSSYTWCSLCYHPLKYCAYLTCSGYYTVYMWLFLVYFKHIFPPQSVFYNWEAIFAGWWWSQHVFPFNPLNAKLNPIRHLQALLGAQYIYHVSRIRDLFCNAIYNMLISDCFYISFKVLCRQSSVNKVFGSLFSHWYFSIEKVYKLSGKCMWIQRFSLSSSYIITEKNYCCSTFTHIS